ncbi:MULTISPECIES: hypothetical protein [Brevibacterium]|uniref:hypothetical protein n=1 Tax=Brevibacterium TaxID=1696 RepID=UPI000DEA3AE5|nr:MULTISPECIES: hypothetical protein [Brevibacterium]
MDDSFVAVVVPVRFRLPPVHVRRSCCLLDHREGREGFRPFGLKSAYTKWLKEIERCEGAERRFAGDDGETEIRGGDIGPRES